MRREPTAGTGTPGPVRVYRRAATPARGPTMLTRRRIALGTVAATAAIACVIGLLTLTTVDLVSGGSVGKGSGRFTLAGGGSKSESASEAGHSSSQQKQQQDSTGAAERHAARPDDAHRPRRHPEQPPTDTAPVPPPTETPPGEPVPQPQSP